MAKEFSLGTADWKRKKLILFDLDGTIHDSSPGIKYCFRKTGEFYNKPNLSDEDLQQGLTGPFHIGIAKVLELREDQVREAIDRYVQFYIDKGQSMAVMFPGIKETIEYLKGRGYMIGLATMMAEHFAKETLHNYGIDHLFDTIHGASLTVPMTKYDIINNCLESAGIEPKDALLIGDGEDDYNSSVKAGIDFIGVTYGYGLKPKFCESRSLGYISAPEDLTQFF